VESWRARSDHGARIRSAATGITMNATPTAAKRLITSGVRRAGEEGMAEA
jgi:hypothetical protein